LKVLVSNVHINAESLRSASGNNAERNNSYRTQERHNRQPNIKPIDKQERSKKQRTK
jgi:hypothetical protein